MAKLPKVKNQLTSGDASGTYGPVLLPSGDTTGATDIAAINAVLANPLGLTRGVSLRLRGGKFYINAPMRQASYTSLVLEEAEVFLASGSNCNMWQNYSLGSALDTDISIKGIGRALFNGNSTGQVRQNVAKTDGTGGTSMAANVGIYPVRIDNFRMEDVQIGPTNAYACAMFGVTKGRISRIRLEQDSSTSNQDGFDLGPGCQDVVIENITGSSGDDAVCIMAIQWWKSTSPDVVPAAYQVGSALTKDVQDITLRDIHVKAGINLVRILNDGNCKVSRVFGSDLKNTGRSGILCFGPNQYVNASHQPATGSISQIQFAGIAGGSPISANSGYAIDISTSVATLTVTDLDLGAFNTGTAYGWKAILGSGLAIVGTPVVSDIVVDGVHSGSTVTSNVGDVVRFQSGMTVSDVVVRRVKLAEANSITKNSSVISNLTLRDIKVGTIYGAAFQSADTGYISDVMIGALSGTSVVYGVAMAAKLGPNTPVFTSNDTAPLATTDGSRIRTDGTLDPNGGGDTTGGEWVANGTAWVKSTGKSDGWYLDNGLTAQLVAGNYYAVLGQSLTTLLFGTDGLMRGGLLVVDRACTITEVGVEVTTAGTAGSLIRLGIWRIPAGTNGPAVLLADAGTVDSTTTGYKSATVSVKVGVGDKLLLTAAAQGAAATGPTTRAVTGMVPQFSSSTATTVSGSALVGMSASGITGALPGTTGMGPTTTIPRVMVKAS